MSDKNPCKKDCPRRSGICHSICKEYKDWATARRKKLDRIYREKQIEGALVEMAQRRANIK